MSSPSPREIVRAAAGSARLLRAVDLNVPAPLMAHLEQAGILARIVPGVYIGAGHRQHPLIEVAGWTLKYPLAVACLLTAAIYHDLTDAFAHGTWLYLPKGVWRPRSQTSRVRAVQVTPWLIDPDASAELGITALLVHGVAVRITNPDRTVADLWRYSDHIPREYALDALRRRVRAEGFHLPAFARIADRVGAWKKMEPVVQGLVLR